MIRHLLNTPKTAAIFALVFSIAVTNQLRADVVVSLSSGTPTVVQGGQLVFDVNLQSDVANAQIYGMDLLVLAGTGDGTQGVFTAGNVDIDSPNQFWDLATLGEAFLSFSITLPFDTLAANTVHQVGQLTLDLSSVAPGNYSAFIDDASLLVLTKNEMDQFVTVNSSNVDFAFTITAVPEPSSLALVVMVGGLIIRKTRVRNAA